MYMYVWAESGSNYSLIVASLPIPAPVTAAETAAFKLHSAQQSQVVSYPRGTLQKKERRRCSYETESLAGEKHEAWKENERVEFC